MIRQAVIEDSREVATLALLLWPDHELKALEEEMKEYICNGAVFLHYEGEKPVGFAQCSLRNDYVEGCESNPVGYLEGIYVRAEYRKQGIALKLLKECEAWAKSQGCREFASDCELDNRDSLSFHLKAGFEEANRIICFRKEL